MLKLGIRVSSVNSSGRGHFERCLAIRNKISQKVWWFVDYESDYIRNKIFKLDELFIENGKNKYGILKKSLKQNELNCILVDSYHINTNDLYKLSNEVPIVVFVDKNATIKADMLICPQPIEFNHTRGIKYLIGPKYAPISEKFCFKNKKNFRNNNILISFGAYDSNGLTLNVIKSIKNLLEVDSLDLDTIITLAKDSPIIKEVKNEIKNISNFKLILDSNNMEDIYKNCVIAIGAPGLSYLERMASGIPSILISQNKLHSSLIDNWVNLGCGIRAYNSMKSIQHKIKLLLLNDDIQKKLIVNGKNLIDGKGAERIAKEIIRLVNTR